MQNKNLIFIMGGFVLFAGAAAFVAGRLLNHQVGPMGPGGPIGSEGNMSFAVNIVPAPELPKAQPEVTGLFVERKDNTIVVSSVSLEAGKGGVVMKSSGGEDEPDGPVTSLDGNSGPKVEVVITSETILYRDTTDFSKPPSGETAIIQETVAEGTLDDLNSDSMIRVWGRKSGDRIIADILFYSSPVVVKSPRSQ